MAKVLAKVRDEALRRHGGEKPGRVRLTHPAMWGAKRRRALVEAAERAGISEPELIPEPVGAVNYFARERAVEPGQYVAVYDLGGGTFDTAVLVNAGDDRFELVGNKGRDGMGGEDFDERLYRHLGAELERRSPAKWNELRDSDERQWRIARADLLTDVRQAKEDLSEVESHTLYVPPPVAEDLTVTRTEFEALIRDDVEGSLEMMEDTIARAGLEPDQLGALYLTGGSSRIPLVARLVRERFRRADAYGDPKAVVALGGVGMEDGQLPDKPTAEEAPDATVPALRIDERLVAFPGRRRRPRSNSSRGSQTCSPGMRQSARRRSSNRTLESPRACWWSRPLIDRSRR